MKYQIQIFVMMENLGLGKLSIEKHVKPVRAVSYGIKAGKYNVLTMMQYLLFVQYTQPKYRDLSKNNIRMK